MATENRELWPGWETVRLLGRGSFGAVYEIQRSFFSHTEKAALKIISIPQDEADIQEMYRDGYNQESVVRHYESCLRNIVKEYALMTEIKGHTNIVYCDDLKYVQHENGIGWDIYIKMELLRPLTDVLGDTVDEYTVARIGRDICSALALCRERNIVHRDVKPQNIFVSQDGNYKLGDFGIARTIEQTTCGAKTGTYKFMAPEVYNLQPYGSRADIYSLGLTLYWLLNERRMPFWPPPPEIPTLSEVEAALYHRFSGEQIPPPAHGSAELKHIVLKACAFDPKDRYKSAVEMREALDSLLQGMKEQPQKRSAEAKGNDNAETGLQEFAQPKSDGKRHESNAADKRNPAGEEVQKAVQQKQTTHRAETVTAKKGKPVLLIAAILAVVIGGLLFTLALRNTDSTETQGESSDTLPQTLMCEGMKMEDAFPDEVFRKYIWEQVLFNTEPLQEGYVLTDVDSGWIAAQKELKLTGVTDLTGIEYFTDLEKLSGRECPLTVMNIGQNLYIKELVWRSNSLQILILGRNQVIETIDVEGNQIAELDVKDCTNLKLLHCGMNALTELDISQNAALESLSCGGNNLTELDVSHNPQLRQLYCSYNQIAVLDVSNNPLLQEKNMFYDSKVVIIH